MTVAAGAAFLVGHGVGADEKFAANKALRAREQATLAAMNMTKSAFQAWSLVCRNWTGNERRCVLFLAVADPDRRQVLLTLSIARTPAGVPALMIDTPAGVAVDQAVSVTAGAVEPFVIAIQSCGPQRCRATTELTPALQKALETAQVTSVTYVKADGQPSTYNLPTRGFRDGLVAWYAGSEIKPPVSASVN